MALQAYECKDCNKEFHVFRVSLKECEKESECPNCKKVCPEVFGVNWKQTHGYKSIDE